MGLKELGGWEMIEMVQKYAHLKANHLLQYANHVNFTSKMTAENETMEEETENKKAVSY